MTQKLDHHVGKSVESVDTEGAAWNITLEDGTKITSHRKSAKPKVENLRLMVVETKKTSDTTFSKMHFGGANQDEVIVDVENGHYEINGEDPHAEVISDIPDDPSEHRVQDEPEGGWEALATRESVENAEG